jgi:hypothetical protein
MKPDMKIISQIMEADSVKEAEYIANEAPAQLKALLDERTTLLADIARLRQMKGVVLDVLYESLKDFRRGRFKNEIVSRGILDPEISTVLIRVDDTLTAHYEQPK